MNRFSIFISLLFLPLVKLFSQEDLSLKYAQAININDLKAHLSIIASDSFEGRNTGEPGQKLASHYIASQFKSFGLAPPVKRGDSLSYFQSFNICKISWNPGYLKIGGKEKVFLEDFFSLANTNIAEEKELDIVYGSYALESFTKEQIKGKAVVMLLDKFDEDEIAAITYSKKYKQLLDSSAAAVLIIPGSSDAPFEKFIKKFKCEMEEPFVLTQSKRLNFINVFFVLPSLGAEMLGISQEQLKVLQSKKSASVPENLVTIEPSKIRLKVSKKIEQLSTENVLGYLEGSDKKNELLVITAHYDHEGIKCGDIYNGADDDGSGTVTILELAKAFSLAKKEGNGPRRSMLFMTVTGEEKGLLGSSYYTSNPIFPLLTTIADLNIDMIGRIDENHRSEDYIYLIGSNRLSTELHKISEEINKKYTGLKFDYTYNKPDDPNQFYYRSDHYNFAKNNIPVIFYFSGTHADYHKPTDDVDKIIFSKIEKTARLVFHTAWELVNREERIKVDVKK